MCYLPYKNEILNKFEAYGLIVASLTLFMALFMLIEDGVSEITQNIITLIVYLLNGFWLLFMMQKLFLGYYQKFLTFMNKYLPCFSKCCCFKKSKEGKVKNESEKEGISGVDVPIEEGEKGQDIFVNQVINPLMISNNTNKVYYFHFPLFIYYHHFHVSYFFLFL